MPAAAISVNPADAVDCEFLNLDFLQDARLLCAACFNCLNFCFHGILLSLCVAPLQDALWYVSFIATAVPINITLIYRVFSSSSLRIHPPAFQRVWRNGTYCKRLIDPGQSFCVANGNNGDIIYNILNLRFEL